MCDPASKDFYEGQYGFAPKSLYDENFVEAKILQDKLKSVGSKDRLIIY